MELLCLFAISLVGLFLSCKTAKGYHLLVLCYAGFPRLFFKPRLEGNSLHPVHARGLCVRPVLPVGCPPEVANSVVRSISVYVINLIFWLNSVVKPPSKPVGGIVFSGDIYADVSRAFVHVSSSGSSLCPTPVLKPSEGPRFRAVRQNFLDAIDVHNGYYAGTELRLSMKKD